MNERLKPCPFCGGVAHFDEYGYGEKHRFVECSKCGAKSEICAEFKTAARKWNRRVKVSGDA